MPTVDETTLPVTTDTPPLPSEDEDAVKAHPLYKELEEKHAAARKGLDDKAIENKRLKKALLEEEEIEVPVPEPKPVTTNSIEEMEKRLRWELKNEDQIELAQEEYDKYRKKGYSEKDSLRLAHLDKGITSSNLSENLRQKATSSAPSTVDRSGGAPGVEGVSESVVNALRAKGKSDEYIRNLATKAKQNVASDRVLPL